MAQCRLHLLLEQEMKWHQTHEENIQGLRMEIQQSGALVLEECDLERHHSEGVLRPRWLEDRCHMAAADVLERYETRRYSSWARRRQSHAPKGTERAAQEAMLQGAQLAMALAVSGQDVLVMQRAHLEKGNR